MSRRIATVMVDGVGIAVHDLGGRGPDLLLAHATGFHGLVWSPLARALAPSFRCIALDGPAHGDSEVPPDGAEGWELFGRAVGATVDALGLRRPFAVGHSWGSAAVLLAEEDRPGTFEAIYCYEAIVPPPGISPPGGPDNPLAASARRRREVFASKDAAFANYAAKPPFDILDPAALRAYVDHGFAELPDGEGDGVRLKCRGEDEARVYEHAGLHHAFAGLDRVACPVTFAAGAVTTTFAAGFYQAHAHAVGQGRVEELPGLGHFGPLQDPRAVAESIRSAFLPFTHQIRSESQAGSEARTL